jgi:ribose/xylose/arabinose/galactoside ABC-type transport system permease subunit
VVLLSMLASALVFLRVEAAWGRAFQGMVLLLAVVLDALRSARLTGPSVISEESS